MMMITWIPSSASPTGQAKTAPPQTVAHITSGSPRHRAVMIRAAARQARSAARPAASCGQSTGSKGATLPPSPQCAPPTSPSRSLSRGGSADRRGGLGPVSQGACTGAGSLFCVGAVFGPDRRLACRQDSEPGKADVGDAEPDGRLRPAAWHRVCGWLRVRPPGRWLRHPQRQLHSRPWSASGAG